ncbi:bifunctional YncE family protein/alkaline phosphatase family protein [Actinopolymorpha alba]|uniref:bifunctional YncE family protein/alkaline phosphatase family protein n=1 Tax=Actinopolymorpha alba TaxID=533267 RepID=UPI00035F6495|nr:bifunctional YncE family protein/alkaline phosphatase family protein [Actinopolymorpha alba]
MHVTRQRRRAPGARLGLLGRRAGHRIRILAAGTAALALAGGGIAAASTEFFGTDQVGQTTDKGLVVSSDQYVNPIGERLVINNGKIMSSSVSPDGTHLAASVTDGGMALAIVDLRNSKVQQLVGNNAAADLRISGNDVGQEGPTYSPDGSQLWLGQADGYRRFTVNPDGSLANPTFVRIAADGPRRALVAEAVFSPDGSTVYSAVNGQNRVVAIDAETGAIEQSWAVGNAPRDMAQVGTKLYVSNEGGRKAKPGDATLNSYNTQVPADPVTAATTTGTVSVIDLANPAADATSIDVGLHPTAMYAKDGALFVTNTASNDVSVIDTTSDKVVQTIATQPWPEASVGYAPGAVTLTDDGHLLVTLGRANAVAVYRYTTPLEPVSYLGLLPTDYYPAEITTIGNDVLVSNTRGIDARRPNNPRGHGTHDTTSSLQRFRLPKDNAINGYTAKVFKQNGWIANSVQFSTGKGDVAPVPVPQRIGDPSTIKHVFLIVKENRTYDQVFGDDPRGNGDPSLAQYGENVTPNMHALARQFGLYDNVYDVGTNSAEGHNWLMQADNPEYTESTAGEYIRSYDTEDDALGHQRTGFIWTGAQAAGKTVRNFGEFHQFLTKPAGATWQNLYCDTKNMAATGQDTAYPMKSSSPIPSLNAVSVPGFPKYDVSVPDIYRYEIWKRDFEKNGPANLNMFWLSSDHTGGPPNGAAQVADNDLATGKIVDAISHSPYWKESAIFVVEDDSQNGIDHVDGHRGPIQIISPWAKHGTVDSHYYTQITMIRTIEQILGIHPMNQKDSAASPMRAAFNDTPDYTPFNAVPNRTPLTLGLSTPPPCGLDTPAAQNPKAAAAPTGKVPADKKEIAAKWEAWKAQKHLDGTLGRVDAVNPVQMNHFSWYEAHEWEKPYPGETKIYAPNQVPGAYLPPTDSDG